jgi:hypothetical protein
MSTATQALASAAPRNDLLSGARAGLVDRWIYVFTAASFVALVLAGFIPDSVDKVAAVQAGKRSAFPLVLHLHAILMGGYLLLLLAQTVLVASGRVAQHRRLGLLAMVLAPALVVVGFVLVPTTYHANLAAAQAAPAALKAKMLHGLGIAENVMLLQGRTGLLFPVLLVLGLRARVADPGFHKRMMILSIAPALTAAFNRIAWIPTTMPGRPVSLDVFILAALAPMVVWDIARNRRVHRAYWVWLAIVAPVTLAAYALWDTPLWHATARRLMGV